MRRTIVAFIGAGIMAISAVGGASADQPTGLEPNPNTHETPASNASDNCLAYFSAIWQHNGLVVSEQDRQAEIKALQAACNNASDQP